ncbi:alpha/beta hydrolase [uncultured Thiothrix sp.]|uniref:alpha/beta hydrolase n=1 Tax=uncultured Thiothrix sp. TaxID=223185 RepID=UPI00261B6756|nr:alpha/beta hydrolase [uncultured Thiothrix sp.]
MNYLHGLKLIFSLLMSAWLLSACTTASVPLGQDKLEPSLIQQPVFRASDGTELVAQSWLPQGKVKANLLLLHGFNEYPGAFDEVGQSFAKQGVAVWAYDQRGFGRSPYRGLWSSSERMAEDAREVTKLLHKLHPQQPLYVAGTSMGGAVALLATGSGDLAADGIILLAPAVWISETQPFYQRWSLEFAKRFTPAWSPTGEGLNIRPSDNIEMLKRIWKSPWMIRQSRIDTVAGLVELMDKSYASADKVKLPVLLLYGEKDQLVPKKPTDMLWARLPKMGKTQQIRYPNGWHMLMRDLQGAKVIHDMIQWMERTN